ncbi:MAG: hypothetical protein WCY11_08965 [Novosphingobium sp.]
MSTCSPERQDYDSSREQPAPDNVALPRDVHLGLQICRANSLSLTRLQLALKQGDRRGVLEAIDQLHDLDTRIGRLLQRLPIHANDDPEAQAIGKYIDEQSVAVAFARLALVSQVSGPDMVSPSHHWSEPDPADMSGAAPSDQPDPPMVARPRFSPNVPGLILALLTFTALVGAILLASGA